MELATVTWCPNPTGVVAPSTAFAVDITRLNDLAIAGCATGPWDAKAKAPLCGSATFPIQAFSCPKCGRRRLRKRKGKRQCPHCGPLGPGVKR